MKRGVAVLLSVLAPVLAFASPAESLVSALEEVRVKTPAGEEVAVLGTVLDKERVAECLATIEEAKGWPASWLVVQDTTLDWDLVLRVVRREDGAIERPDPVFATARREWSDDADLEAAYREAFGRKPPREKERSLVVQSFSKKIVTTYVYEGIPKEKKGLMVHLPDGSLLREAKSVELGNGAMHTVALVLVEPRFVPSACDTPEALARGHVDEGRVLLVLAGAETLEGRIDVTDRFATVDDPVPAVPRYACMEGDAEAARAGTPVGDRLRGRPNLPLLILEDRRAKGEGVAVVARVRTSDAGETKAVLAHVAGKGEGAHLLEALEESRSHGHGHGHDDATVRHGFDDADRWAKVFDDPARDAWQKPEEVIRLLGVREGQSVADLGAGTGYFSVPLAKAVGAKGRVHALDVEEGLVAHIAERGAREGLPQIESRTIPRDDPGLAAGSVDLVLIVNTWHHIDDRIAYVGKLAKALKPGGRVAVVDYAPGDLPVGPPAGHKLTPSKVVAEFEAGGLSLVLRDVETLPYQYVLAFGGK
jgi:predicted methyltransferase